MKSEVNIYLSGSIKKGRTDERGDEAFWSPAHEEEILTRLSVPARLLNPAKSPIRRNDYFVNYGCDLFLVGKSDVVLVDLRAEKGIGVGAELMYAYHVGRPVIGWLPPNSYYRRDKVEDVFGEDLIDWIHPFAFGLCDIAVDTLADACSQINQMIAEDRFEKAPGKSPENALNAFKNIYGGELNDVWKRASRSR